MKTSTLPLGKHPFVADRRDLLLKDYIDKGRIVDSPAIPGALDWYRAFRPDGSRVEYDRDPLYNLEAGCCVLSAPAHQLRLVGQITGNVIAVDSEAVKRQYIADTGYNPDTGENNTGMQVRDMLKRAKKTGLFGLPPALGFAKADPFDAVERLIAQWLGCGTIDGYSMPIAGADDTDGSGRLVWTKPAGGWPEGQGPGTRGGHCFLGHGADAWKLGNTWGYQVAMDDPWTYDCIDESWVLLWPQWILASGRAPNGFALADLLADAAARGQEG
jgi:hypothetical protein